MRFYIASGLKNAAAVQGLARALKDLGHEQTYDWTVHGSVHDSPEKWPIVSQAETQGVLTADVVIGMLPGGRGTHFELGLALGCGHATIFLYACEEEHLYPEGRTCVFYWHPRIIHVRNDEELLRGIWELYGRLRA